MTNAHGPKSEDNSIPLVSSAGTMRGEMLYRELGFTGESVSVIGMGGSHLGLATVEEDLAIRLVHEGLDRGINFLDNCWDYNEGRSEERVGKALSQEGYRQKAFVMTKIDGRTKEVAANQIDTSLKRLKVDHIDLLQHHEILRYDDPDRIFNEGGSIEAVLAAKQAGKVRFIGFTGHKDPPHSPSDAGCCQGPRIPLRHHTDAYQCHGCTFSEFLPTCRSAGFGGEDRGPGHEKLRRWDHLEERRSRADELSALFAKLADLRVDHRHRQKGDIGSGIRGGEVFQAEEPSRSD
jgi:Aldo/keto reductase family